MAETILRCLSILKPFKVLKWPHFSPFLLSPSSLAIISITIKTIKKKERVGSDQDGRSGGGNEGGMTLGVISLGRTFCHPHLRGIQQRFRLLNR